MERISAACAMDWSIELEKSLRSKRPGQAIKAIQQIGSRLQQWSREPKPIMAVYNMFGLVPGEDRLFANTILLRLADAFRLGGNDIRLSVVRVFLSEVGNHQKEKKGEQYKRILSRAWVYNQMELLKRVKIVFDTGDVESRALSLVLFGCWADFAKDSAHIRYLILSSLISSEILEVKASLFAAGCFCELAVDFALVVLEMLHNIVISLDISMAIKSAGVRVFSKMGCTYSIANKAHKIGLKLAADSLEEDVLVALLVSLSKLAVKSTLLLSDQVNLLLSFLSVDRPLRLQATALRCLHFLVRKVFCHPTIRVRIIQTALTTVDKIELPSAMKYEAVQILHKMLVYGLPDLPCENMLEFTYLLKIIEKAATSPIMSERLIAIRVLVDASTQMQKRNHIRSNEDSLFSLPERIISIIMDQMILMVKPLLDQNNSEVFKEFQSLLNFLLFLVREHPGLGVMVLDKVGSCIECLVDTYDSSVTTKQSGVLVDELVNCRGQKMSCGLNVINSVHRFLVSCVENLNEVGTVSTEIIDKVKILVEHVQRCRLFGQYIHVIFSILLHSQIIWGCMIKKPCIVGRNLGDPLCNQLKPCIVGRNLGDLLCSQLVEHEILSLEHIEKMLTERDNWPIYKAGTFAAYQGSWVTAAFVFEQLIGKVRSHSCSCWLKALAQFTQSEGKIQLFVLPNLKSRLVDWLQRKESRVTFFGNIVEEIGQVPVEKINKSNYAEVLVGAYDGLCASGETLRTLAKLGRSCFFQRWFLALKAKVLRNVVDVLNILGNVPLIEANINNEQVEKGVAVECLESLRKITQISFEMKSLAQELDLIAMSFIGMDRRSSNVISALALSCSLLAFTTGFAFFFLDLNDNEIFTASGLESSRNCSQEMLIRNLFERLRLVDQETCSNLCLLLAVGGQSKDCFHSLPRAQVLNSGGEVREILDICKYAASSIVGLQKKAKGMHREDILSLVTKDGFQLVLKTFTKWIDIPFHIPKYFFKVRPCIGSELFAFSAETNSDKLNVSPGFYLSINLCLQLRNLPPNLTIRLTKLYCILCSSASFPDSKSSGETEGQIQLDYRDWEIPSMIAMNEKLLQYITERAKKIDKGKRGRDYDNDSNNGIVYRFLCFELNEKGQGFSNCLLDVSDFPIGSYRIKWHSCCMDSEGSYWSFLPLNTGPVFNVQKPHVVG